MKNFSLNIRGELFTYTEPVVMGIVNLTDDSFYSDSRVNQDNLLPYVSKMLEDGADWLDIGASSSRPGAVATDIHIETERISSAVVAIRKEFGDVVLSIDTYQSAVAKAGIENGADIINDISAGSIDPEILEVVKDKKVPYVLMHMKGTPANMQDNTDYNNVTLDVYSFLQDKIDQLEKMDIKDIIVDPGFGFGKSIDQNYQLLRELEHFQNLNKPVLVGVSRKSMTYKALNTSASEALNGTTVLNTIATLKGASILRVHDVKEAKEVLTLARFVR